MRATTAASLFRPQPFPNPYLEVAVALDAACPGHLASALHGSPLARQARFFAYSAILLHGHERIEMRLVDLADHVRSGNARSRLAQNLTAMRASSIIEGLTGYPVPAGFLALLKRCGDAPLSPDPRIYQILWSLAADPANRDRLKLLQQTEGQITAAKIRIVSELEALLLRKAVLDRVYDPAQVQCLQKFVQQIREQCLATDDEIAASLDRLSGTEGAQSLSSWTQSWVRKQRRSSHSLPFPDSDPGLRLRLGADLAELGRRMRNCAGDRLCDAWFGESFIYEWVGDFAPAAIEVRAFQDSRGTIWICEDVRGERNADPSPELAAAVRAKLDTYGVRYRIKDPIGSPAYSVRKLLHHWSSSGLQLGAADSDEADEDLAA